MFYDRVQQVLHISHKIFYMLTCAHRAPSLDKHADLLYNEDNQNTTEGINMDFTKLNTYMEQMTDRGIPASELAVTLDGKCVYRKCVGFSDTEGKKPTSPRDIYWIYSATKVLTCISALRLIEEGKLSLSDPVAKYIPAFADVRVRGRDGTLTPAQNVMTIEHLFTMTGGMTYEFPDVSALSDRSTVAVVSEMAKTPLVFEPGTHYKYSLCHDVLAAVVEVVSGMRFSEYLNTIMFRPLGIVDMGFFPNEEQRARVSTQYSYRNGVGRSVPLDSNMRGNLSDRYESGGGGIFSTVDEYMKVITTIACGGTTADGYTLLRPETIERMKVNRLCDDAWNDFVVHRLFGYGWGLCGRVHVDPVRSGSRTPVGEFGWDGMAGAFVLMDTDNRLALYYAQHVIGCGIGAYSVHHTIKNMVYEALGL